MKKIILLTLCAFLTIQHTQTAKFNTGIPIVQSVVAAGQAVVDVPAGLVGKSIYPGESANRPPIVGVVPAAFKDAGNIVVGVGGASVYDEDDNDNKQTDTKNKNRKKYNRHSQKSQPKEINNVEKSPTQEEQA